MQYRSAIAFAFLLLTACCAHTPVHPPSFGFHGRVRPHHDVACVIDADMTLEYCGAVAAAVDKIDAAVGYELLSRPRVTTIQEARAAEQTRETIYVGVDHLEGPVLGVTYATQYEMATGFLRLELVVFDPQIFADRDMRDAVVLHELLHAVGADHASQVGPYQSVIRPQWTPGAPTELTANDVAALRAAYAL